MTQRFEVREQVLLCTACGLRELCSAPVPFTGPTPSYLALVGEAPGKVEDQRGEPFVGPAGELFRDALTEAGINPAETFMCNTCSCWPARDERTPRPAEINACSHNLEAQLRLANPVWICLVGGIALSTVRSDLKISKARGHVLCPPDGPFVLSRYYPVLHPSYALRNVRGEQVLRNDLKNLAWMLGQEDWTKGTDDSCVVCGTSPEDIGEHDLHVRCDAWGATYCSACWQTSPTVKAEVKVIKRIERTQERTGQLFR